MKVEMRKTISGTEYWDTKDKKTLFVPAGEKPKFEVTEDPKSMIHQEDDKKVVEPETDINKMTVPQLKEYAAANEIEIPADITKKDDIVNYLTADSE